MARGVAGCQGRARTRPTLSRGRVWRPATLPVFKTGEGHHARGGFDSHTLPPRPPNII
jgi:hypothetical protein